MATKNKLREYHIVKAKSKSSVIFTEHISDDFTYAVRYRHLFTSYIIT